jgi:hypothetical protein
MEDQESGADELEVGVSMAESAPFLFHASQQGRGGESLGPEIEVGKGLEPRGHKYR